MSIAFENEREKHARTDQLYHDAVARNVDLRIQLNAAKAQLETAKGVIETVKKAIEVMGHALGRYPADLMGRHAFCEKQSALAAITAWEGE